MKSVKYLVPEDLAALAKKCRMDAGKTQAEAAREMGVKRPSLHRAEECPHLPYTKLRRRIIEKYSTVKITGPLFRIEPLD